MNNLSIVGRIGKVGELRYTQSDKAVISFSVAVDNGKDADGEKRTPTWFEITLWEKQAEGLSKYLAVGDRIGISGQVRLKIDKGKDGQEYHKLTVDFPRVELMGDGSKDNEDARPAQRTTQRTDSRPAVRQSTQQRQEVDDDSIPF